MLISAVLSSSEELVSPVDEMGCPGGSLEGADALEDAMLESGSTRGLPKVLFIVCFVFGDDQFELISIDLRREVYKLT
jgi:hypothetical protein